MNFQKQVQHWMMACFSMEVCRDGAERNHRFLEEALELVQALNCTRDEAHQLVDYVYDRPTGNAFQELGGVQLTLAALCFANDFDMAEAAKAELTRVWQKIDVIREKQANKPKHSPLPEATRQQRLDASLAKQLGDSIALNARLRIVITDSIQALERGSTSAPVVECLKAALQGES